MKLLTNRVVENAREGKTETKQHLNVTNRNVNLGFAVKLANLLWSMNLMKFQVVVVVGGWGGEEGLGGGEEGLGGQ